MTWNTNTPRGDLLPATERPRFQGNWSYIQTEMRDNHYWDEDSNKDGRHKRCDMPDLETDGDITVDANGDPDVIPTSCDGMYYVRSKTSTEAPGGQFSEPFYAMNDGSNLQFLQMGIRAMCSFRVSGGAIVQNGGNNWDYQHNISNISYDATGRFTITFATALPTANYIVLATPEASSTSSTGGMKVANIQQGTKAVGSVTIKVQRVTSSSSVTTSDPDSLSVIILGG